MCRRRDWEENPLVELRHECEPSQGEVVESCCQEKPLSDDNQATVPQTDTGRRVENTKANGRTFVKELGKLAP